MELNVFFYPGSGSPYIRKLHELNMEQMYIFYNGYYYIENKFLPKTEKLIISVEKNPGHNEITAMYDIEIYKKEEIADTSVFGHDGICFYPTGDLKLYFRILKEE
jgi:hypothetical protein